MALPAGTTYSVFAPNSTTAGDPSAVPAAIAAANCLSGGSSAACDALVGGIAMGTGACAGLPLASTALCACVNNALPCPQFTAPACANNAGAYQTVEQADAGGACANLPLCINLVASGGVDPVISNINQVCGVSSSAINWIETHRGLAAALVFIFVILLALLAGAIASHAVRGRASSLPVAVSPPQAAVE
jgi:hypothetical protein